MLCFLIRCRNNNIHYTTLMNELNNISNTIAPLKQIELLNVILYEYKNFDNNNDQSKMDNNLDSNSNQSILTIIATIKSIRYTTKVDEPLFWVILSGILDNSIYEILFKNFLLFNFIIIITVIIIIITVIIIIIIIIIIIYYFCLWRNRKRVFLYCPILYSH